MSRYVYPIFEENTGTYYGAPTSEKLVRSKLESIISFREERAKANTTKLTVEEHKSTKDHPNDRFFSVLITEESDDAAKKVERFSVYQSKVC